MGDVHDRLIFDMLDSTLLDADFVLLICREKRGLAGSLRVAGDQL
jgi:hypothetical protein